MGKYVINPLKNSELKKFLDIKSKEIIKYFIVKSLFSQPESKIGQKSLPIQIPKEHIEQWFTQALNVKPVGAGSYPVDIYNETEHWGADVKMLNIKVDRDSGDIKNDDSGEASLGQKFTGTGVDLDELFKLKKYEEIKDGWILLYRDKYEALKNKYPSIQKIFYLFILRPSIQETGTNFYFTGAVLDLDQLKNVIVDLPRTIKGKKISSVFLKNFIPIEFGNTKIYKAKKRLELRLRPKKWIDSDYAIKISTSFSPQKVDLRNMKINSEYLKNEVEKMNLISIKFEV